jgi:hypothetical protein|tara:strand:- start:632 stop:958 length:327 start_codon:yes stop_codon:yes gene_type:complete
MRWLWFAGGIMLGLWVAKGRYQASQDEPVPELPDNPDKTFARRVQGEAFLENQKFNEDYWNRWKAKNIVTMSDKMWDYQMDRYKLYEDGKISNFAWANPVMPPSKFYS